MADLSASSRSTARVDIAVRPADASEIGAVARIHADALPDDFLPSLGLDFLESVYYPATFSSPFAATLVATTASRPVGFVTIAHDTRRFSRDVLIRRVAPIGRYAVRAAWRRPSHLRCSVEVLWSVLRSRPDPIDGEIVFIAVDRASRGAGVGKALVGASLAYLAEHHVSRCRTKTLAGNTEVIAMYEGLGWHVRDRFRLIGREYVTVVSPPIAGRRSA